MKVIAINDAPLVNRMKAYKKGDIFDVYDAPFFQRNYLIIYHHRLEVNMDVNPENFITLSEWRESKLKELGI